MKSKRMNIILLALVAMLLLTAAGPLVPSNNTRDQVRLTVDNQSDQTAYLRLEGDNFYYLTNAAGTKSIWTPASGEYIYMLYTCGHRLNGTLDLSKNHTLVVPPCGDKVIKKGKADVTDAGSELKLIRIWMENIEYGTFFILLKGPGGEYVFRLPAEVRTEWTIPKGDYDYTMYACGKIETGILKVTHGKGWEFNCPTN